MFEQHSSISLPVSYRLIRFINTILYLYKNNGLIIGWSARRDTFFADAYTALPKPTFRFTCCSFFGIFGVTLFNL